MYAHIDKKIFNVSLKNTVQFVKEEKENVGIVKIYPQNVQLMVIVIIII